MSFYHATYRAYIESIKEHGLGGILIGKAWEISQDQEVYLASEPEIAFSFAECAEDIPDDVYESGIVVLMVNDGDLDPSYLSIDDNIVDNEDESIYSVKYNGIIRPNELYVVTEKHGVLGKLTEIKKVICYEN